MQVSNPIRAVVSGFVLVAFGGLVAGCSSSSSFSGGSSAGKAPFAGAESVQLLEQAKKDQLPRVRLLLSSNVDGETDSCGCSVNPKGGLDRRWNYVQELRKAAPSDEPVLVVDAGNALFPTFRLDPSRVKFLEERARLILKGHRMMGLQQQGVGALDLADGAEFLKREATLAGIELTSASWTDAKDNLLFAKRLELTLPNGPKVALVSVSSGREDMPTGLKVIEPVKALKGALEGIAKDSLVVVLSDLGQEKDKELMTQIDRALIFVGARDLNSLEAPYLMGDSMLVQPQMQGQQWVELLVAVRADASGWFSSREAAKVAGRLDTIQDNLSREKDAAERKSLKQAQDQVMLYSLKDLAHKNLYEFSLVDMTAAYAQPNILSPFMAKLKNPPK